MRFLRSLTAVLAVTLLGLVACGITNTAYASENRSGFEYGGWSDNGDPDSGNGATSFSIGRGMVWLDVHRFSLYLHRVSSIYGGGNRVANAPSVLHANRRYK